MNTKEQQPITTSLKKAIRTIGMDPNEKAAIRSALLAEMLVNPLPQQAESAGVRNAAPSRHQYGRSILPKTKTMTRMTIALLIALLLGGGVSYAAEGTAPGDTLYPIKIHVTENVESALAVSAEAQAKLDAQFALRRLDEAEHLKTEAKLDAQTAAELRSNFDAHTARVETTLNAMKEKSPEGSAQISLDFETALEGRIGTLSLLGIAVHSEGAAAVEETNGMTTEHATSIPATNRVHTETLLNAIFRANDSTSARNTSTVISGSGAGTDTDGAIETTTGTQSTNDTSVTIDLGDKVIIDAQTNTKSNTGSATLPVKIEGSGSGVLNVGL